MYRTHGIRIRPAAALTTVWKPMVRKDTVTSGGPHRLSDAIALVVLRPVTLSASAGVQDAGRHAAAEPIGGLGAQQHDDEQHRER